MENKFHENIFYAEVNRVSKFQEKAEDNVFFKLLLIILQKT